MAHTLNEYLDTTAAKDAEALSAVYNISIAINRTRNNLRAYISQDCDIAIEQSILWRAAEMGWAFAGEGASRLPQEVKGKYSDIPWGTLKEIRNIYTHRGEKYFGSWEKLNNRLKYLRGKVHPGDVMASLLKASKQESGEVRRDLEDAIRGLAMVVGFVTLCDDDPQKLILIDSSLPDVRISSQIIGVSPDELFPAIVRAQSRTMVLEAADYLSACSLFVDNIPEIQSALPNNYKKLRNDIAHFNDAKRDVAGAIISFNDKGVGQVAQRLGTLEPVLKKRFTALQDTRKATERMTIPADEIISTYNDLLTRRLKPDAICYLDKVVEKVTSRPRPNPRLEQAIIIAASKLLRERPLPQAQAVIDFVLENPVDIMHRDENGKLDAVTSYQENGALNSYIRRFVTDVQQNCTRSHAYAANKV